MDPLTSEVAIPEPEIGKEAIAELELASKAEESPAVSAPEPVTPCTIEVIPAAIDHSLVTESGIHDDENAVNQSESVELGSELEPRSTEAEHMFSPVEDKTDVSDGKTSDSAPIIAAIQQLPEVTSKEIIQPQSTAVLVSESVQDKEEDQVEIITSSTTLEGYGAAEIEAKKDYVDKEVDFNMLS
jgi:hypothetical protein